MQSHGWRLARLLGWRDFCSNENHVGLPAPTQVRSRRESEKMSLGTNHTNKGKRGPKEGEEQPVLGE